MEVGFDLLAIGAYPDAVAFRLPLVPGPRVPAAARKDHGAVPLAHSVDEVTGVLVAFSGQFLAGPLELVLRERPLLPTPVGEPTRSAHEATLSEGPSDGRSHTPWPTFTPWTMEPEKLDPSRN